MALEEHLIPPERWDLEVPPEVRVHGVEDEGSYPIGYGRNPEKGWFVLSGGQGSFIVWAQWLEEPVKKLDFSKPTEVHRYRQPLINTLTRLQQALQNTGPQT